MQSTTQAAPAAIDPETLSDLFIADAALRRLCECLDRQRHPVPGVGSPTLSLTVLHLVIENISERLAECTHALLTTQEAQS